jgi:hypothetical protein
MRQVLYVTLKSSRAKRSLGDQDACQVAVGSAENSWLLGLTVGRDSPHQPLRFEILSLTLDPLWSFGMDSRNNRRLPQA